jgi:DNA invertase Pin-like site-specific DNA recombinase
MLWSSGMVYHDSMLSICRPVAYVRRSSRSRNDPGDVSREFQVREVRRLAGADADRLEIRDQDWGRSGSTDKTVRRLAFLAILDEVERGEVSALYAYATDRLARSVEWAARLLNACRRAGVPIITSEGRFDPDNGMTDQLFYFQAMQNEGYSRQASQKRRATVERQIARGSRLGVAPFGALPGESLEPIISAFRTAGSCYGAARILNQDGHRTRRGAFWTSKVIGDILRREGVIYRRRPRPGAKAHADWVTYQLLICPCGNTMTSMDRRSPRVTCYKARSDPSHERPHGISEAKLLPALMAEAARLRLPVAGIEIAAKDEQRRSALATKRDRVLDMYAEGLIDKVDRTRRLGEIDDALDGLDSARVLVDVPAAVDWTGSPTTVNAVLLALWERVELGPDLMPARFVWRVPEWRD